MELLSGVQIRIVDNERTTDDNLVLLGPNEDGYLWSSLVKGDEGSIKFGYCP